MIPSATPILLFDGSCGMCSRAVRFVLAHESSKEIVFVPSASPAGQVLIERYRLGEYVGKTMVYISPAGKISLRSSAVLELCRHLKAPYKWLTAFIFIPAPLRDLGYRPIAYFRHRISQRLPEECALFTEEEKKRIIVD